MEHITKITGMFWDYGFIIKSIKQVEDNNCEPSIGFSIIAMKGPKWIGVDPDFFMRNYSFNCKEEGYIVGEEYEEILESHEIPDESSNETETPMDYIKRKRREFLEETTAHFSVNPRAIDSNDSCVYSHSANGGCAIGRKLPADLAEEFDCMGIEGGMSVSNEQVFGLLPLELSMLGDKFLQRCQYLHDICQNWDQKGLSYRGKREVSSIIESFC